MKKYRIFFKETFLGRMLTWAATYLVLSFQVLPVFALPQGETVVHGDVTFERNGPRMTVNQETSRAIVNYDGFGIGSGEGVQFVQPDSSAAILNRVTGPGSSEIAGQLSANGRVFLINPNGVLFTPSAQVDVGALVASALNMSDSDFLAGHLRFAGGGGPVRNEGTLNGGFVYLLGGTVENRGTIRAGEAILAAGQSILIDKAVNGKITLTIDDEIVSSNQWADVPTTDGSMAAAPDDASASPTNASSAVGEELAEAMAQAEQEAASPVLSFGTVLNEGVIDASGDVGGTVLAHGAQVGQLGTIHADGLAGDGGAIELHATEVVVLGEESVTTANAGPDGKGGEILIVGDHAATIATGARIEAKGGSRSGDGGFVETSGKESFRIGAAPDVSAAHGQGGTWLIDPYNIVITNGAELVHIGTNNLFYPSDSNAVIGIDVISDSLSDGVNVQISTGSEGDQEGNIDWLAQAILNYNCATGNLTLNAANNISFNGTIAPTNAGDNSLNLTFNANSDSSGGGDVAVNGRIDLHGGSFTNHGVNFTSDAGGDVTTEGGSIVIDHTGDVTLGGDLNAGSGDVSLKVDGAITNTGGLISGDGLTAYAGGPMTLHTKVNTLAASNVVGAIDVTDEDALTLSKVQAGNGPISVTARGILVASNAVSLNDIRLTGNSIWYGTIDAGSGGGVTLEAGAGAIKNLTDGSISGDTLTAHAAGAMTLNTKVSTLTATNSVGVVDVTEADNLTLGNVWAGNGSITLKVGGAITTNATGGLVSGDTLTAYAGGAMALNTKVNTLVAANSNGAINVTEADGIVLSDVQAGNGSIKVTAGGPLTASKVISLTGSTNNSISLTTKSGGIQVGVVDAKTNGNVTLEAPGSIEQVSGMFTIGNKLTVYAGSAIRLNTKVETLVAANSSNLIDVTEMDGITLEDVRATNGLIKVMAGDTITALNVVSVSSNISLTTTNGGIQVDAMSAKDVDLTTPGSITQLSGGALTASGLVFQAGGAVALDQAGNNVQTVTGGAGGAIALRDTMGLELVSVTNATGGITVTTAGGKLTADQVTAGAAGNVTLATTGSGDVLVDNVTANGGTITVASAGAIEESGADAAADLTAGTVRLNAQSGIGAVDTLELAAQTISATNASGNVQLANAAGGAATADLAVTAGAGSIAFSQTGGSLSVNATTADGFIFVANASNTLTAGTVTVGGQAGVVLATTGSGDVLVNNVTASSGVILVVSAGAIEESGADPAADLTAGTVQLNAQSGIGAAGTLELAAQTISATSASGNVQLANAASGAATADLAVTAGAGSIAFSQTGGSLSVNATTVDGSIAATNAGNTLTADQVTAGAAGNVTLTTTGSGNVLVNNVTANGGAITVASAGAIEEFGADAAADLTAGTVQLNAQSGIGAVGTLELAAQTISATSASGNVQLANAAGGAATADLAVTAGAGSIAFSQTGGSLSVNATTVDGSIAVTNAGATLMAGTVTAGAAGNVTLTTTGSGDVLVDNVSGGTITVASSGAIEESGADAAADLTAGTVRLNAQSGIGAAGTLELAAQTISATSASGNVQLANAAGGAATADLAVTAGAGSIAFSQTGGSLSVNATTVDGSIAVTNVGNTLTADQVTAGAAGNVTLTTTGSGNVLVNNVTANGGTIAVASSGAIEEFGADAAADLTAGTVRLNAQSGIGAAGTLELAAQTISATNASGNVQLANAAGGAATADLAVTAGAGSIAFSQTGGSLSVNATTVDGSIAVTNAGATLTAGTVTAGAAGNVTLTTTGLGDVLVNNVTANGGTITVASAGAIEEFGADAAADLTAGTVRLNAQSGIGAAGTLELAAQTISATNASGNVQLANAAGGAATADLAVTAGAGSIAFSQTGGPLSVNARTANGLITVTADDLITALNVVSLTDNDANDISLTGNGIVYGTINAGSQGDVKLEAGAGAIANAGGGLVRGDELTAHARDAITLNTAVNTLEATNNNGAIVVTDEGALTLSKVQAGNGPISVTAGGLITALNVASLAGDDASDINLTGNGIVYGTIDAGSQGDVKLEAGAGAIANAGGGLVRGDELTAHARDAITLNTAVNTLEATNNNGAIVVTDEGALTLSKVQAGNGPISVTAGGLITALNVASLAGDDASDINLTGNGIVYGTINAGSQGDVKLEAGAGAIENEGGGLIRGDELTAHARDAITLNTAVNTLEATNNNGAIVVTDEGALTLSKVQAGNGPISVTAGGLITASNVASLAGNDANDISLTGNGIVYGTINAGSQGDVKLEAGAGAIANAGGGLIRGDELTAHARDAITLNTAVNTLEATNNNGAIDVTEADGITLVNVQAGDGPIRVRAGGTLVASNVVSLGPNESNHVILTTTSGDIQAFRVDAWKNLLLEATAGNVTLNADVRSITGNVSVVAANSVIQNANITVVNGNGSIDVEGKAGSVTMASGTVSQTAGGNIRYKADQDVVLGRLNAGNGMVAVVASNNIENNGDRDITASATLLWAKGSITSSVPGGVIAARSDGNIILDATNAVTVGAVGPIKVNRVNADSSLTTLTNGPLEGLETVDGAIRLTAAGTITVSNEIHAGGSGGVSLDAFNSDSDIIVKNTIRSDANHICLVADDNIVLSGDVRTAGNGAIALWADRDGSGVGDVIQNAGAVKSVDGSIYIAGFNVNQASPGIIKTDGRGSIVVHASNDLNTVNISSSSGNLAMEAARITIGGSGLNAGDTLVLRAHNGSITGSGKAKARNIGLSASKDIGTKTDLLDINADTLAAVADSGSIYLKEENSVTAGTVDLPGVGQAPSCAQDIPRVDVRDLQNIRCEDGDFIFEGGGDFIFSDLTAGNVQVDAGGIGMGVVNADAVVFRARGDIDDNGSMLNVSDLTLQAGGNIGAAGDPINLNVRTIGNVSGDNVYLLQEAAGDVRVALIQADNHVELGVPNGKILDAEADADQPDPDIIANSARLDAQQIGERQNPLDLQIAGDLEIVNSKEGPDQGRGFVWALLQGEAGSVMPDYDLNIPGLIILNNQIVGGADEVMREIFRTEAFYVEIPELRSKYGVFGSPYFLHSYLQISEPVAVGLIDYILYGQARVNADPEMPPIPNIIKGGPRAGYVVRLTAKPLVP